MFSENLEGPVLINNCQKTKNGTNFFETKNNERIDQKPVVPCQFFHENCRFFELFKITRTGRSVNSDLFPKQPGWTLL
jgi:hypothetical protein